MKMSQGDVLAEEASPLLQTIRAHRDQEEILLDRIDHKPMDIRADRDNLLLAIRANRPTNDILHLIDENPMAAQLRLANGRYPLHEACQQMRKDRIRCTSPVITGTFFFTYAFDTVIMKLLEVFPQAAHFPDAKGWYPLHIACLNNQSENVIFKLIEIYPDAVAKKVIINDGMFNPLQLLAFLDRNANVVKYLLQFPDLDVNATDNAGDSALHIAIDGGNFDIVDALLRHPFIMIDQRNHYNKTPFDLVDQNISRIQNLDDDDDDEDLPKYQHVKQQLEDQLVMTRWGSFEYFYQNVEDWSMNQ